VQGAVRGFWHGRQCRQDQAGAAGADGGAVCEACEKGSIGKEASTSFLKKRSKKLFCPGIRAATRRTAGSKSFLVLFFKKELLFPSF
jgi:hypothetical protein